MKRIDGLEFPAPSTFTAYWKDNRGDYLDIVIPKRFLGKGFFDTFAIDSIVNLSDPKDHYLVTLRKEPYAHK